VKSGPGTLAPSDSLETIDPAPVAASDLDFDFELGETPVPGATPIEEPLMPVDGADLAQATILDPNGASGYDVSSSDLDDPLHIGPSPSAPTDPEPMSEPSEIPAPPPVDRSERSVPTNLSDLPDLSESVDAVHEDHTGLTADPLLATPERVDEPIRRPFALDPSPSETTDATDPSPFILEPEELPPPIPERTPEPMLDAKPAAGLEFTGLGTSEPVAAVTAEPDSGTAPMGAKALEEIAPKLRAQLHDTLEKIAWESFSDLTETIVRQAVDRVEQVAWEVIPQLAETLVREEIRRMKGDDS
jgi:hypothetical protein